MSLHDFVARNFKPYSLAKVMQGVESSKMNQLKIQGAEAAQQRQETVTDLLNPYFRDPNATFGGAAKLVAPYDIKSAYMLSTIGSMGKKKGTQFGKPFVVDGNRYQRDLNTNKWRSLGKAGGKGSGKSPGYPTNQELNLTSSFIDTYGDDATKNLTRTKYEDKIQVGETGDYDKFEVHVASRARKIQKDQKIDYADAVKQAYDYYKQFIIPGEKEYAFGEDSWFNKLPYGERINDALISDKGSTFVPPNIKGKTDESFVFKQRPKPKESKAPEKRDRPSLKDALAWYKKQYGDRFSAKQITSAYEEKYGK